MTNSAGEIGHTTVDPEGMMCDCGKAGCLQTYINIPSLLSEASKIKPVRTIEELFAERRAGTRWATYLIDRALAYMAITINNVVSMYNPDSVILSGEILDKFLKFTKRSPICATHSISGNRFRIPLRLSAPSFTSMGSSSDRDLSRRIVIFN